jgi:hypothetical protein
MTLAPVTNPPHGTYLSLMRTIRGRLDLIEQLKESTGADFLKAESAAFQARKIVEAIAFGCLVAVENGLTVVPRDAKGQWNAEDILKNLDKKNLSAFPSPSLIRAATLQEQNDLGVKSVVEGIAERRLTRDELIEIYQRLHRWLHGANPYTYASQSAFHATFSPRLWEDVSKVRRFIEKHFIAIRGAAFFCVTHDDRDGQTKVIGLNKTET